MTIKIITGYSNPGGSTTAFINLTNLFNDNGIECILYGPNQWHLDKCNGEKLDIVRLDRTDDFICHYFHPKWQNILPRKYKGKKIYSCHETEVYPVKNVNYKKYDKIHYVSEYQKDWHDVDYSSCVIPNVVDDLKPSLKKSEKVAGIIGSIDNNKQTHISINRALNDDMKVILLFGKITEPEYYEKEIKPLLDSNKNIIYVGHIDDKQKIYDLITDAYLSSLKETWCYVKKECELTETNFHGNTVIDYVAGKSLSNEEILQEWIKVLEID